MLVSALRRQICAAQGHDDARLKRSASHAIQGSLRVLIQPMPKVLVVSIIPAGPSEVNNLGQVVEINVRDSVRFAPLAPESLPPMDWDNAKPKIPEDALQVRTYPDWCWCPSRTAQLPGEPQTPR